MAALVYVYTHYPRLPTNLLCGLLVCVKKDADIDAPIPRLTRPLEPPLPAASAAAASDAAGGAGGDTGVPDEEDPDELVLPPVDASMLSQLMEFGFPETRVDFTSREAAELAATKLHRNLEVTLSTPHPLFLYLAFALSRFIAFKRFFLPLYLSVSFFWRHSILKRVRFAAFSEIEFVPKPTAVSVPLQFCSAFI